MHRHHPVGPCAEDAGLSGSGGLVPDELDVALVAEHRYAVMAAPLHRGGQIVDGAGGVARRVHPQTQRAGDVVGVHRAEIDAPLVVERHGNRPAASQRSPHGVGGIGDRRIQNGVATGIAQPQVVGHRGHQLLGAHAGRHRRTGGVDAEPSGQPVQRSLPVGRGSYGGRIATLAVGGRERSHHFYRGRIGRCPHRQVHAAAVEVVGHRSQLIETVVGVWRGNETVHYPTTHSESRAADASSRRAWIR